MAKIIKQFSKQIIPFSYKIFDAEAFTSKKSCDGKNIWNETVFNTNHLFDYVNAKQNALGKQGIMTCLTLSDGARKHFDLPNANSEIVLCSRGNQSDAIPVKLKNVSLYLFETNVGFADFDFEYMSEKIEDYTNANYFLSELKSKDNTLKIKKGKDEYNEITLGQVLEKIFALFDEVSGFDKNNQISFYDLKPLLFSTVILDSLDADEHYLLNHASRNFKDSYQTEDVKTLSPFTNSSWAGTDTALVNVSHLTGENKQTDEFFLTQFCNSSRNNYFYLFLLTLNQKFTLLKRLSQIAQINPKYIADDAEQIKSQSDKVSDLIYKSRLYDARCNFNCPSSMQHINEFYDYARNCQSIALFENELKRKVSSLVDIHTTYKSRLDDIRSLKNTKLTFWAFVLSQIVGSISLFTSGCKLVSDLLGISVREQPIYYIIPVVITLSFAVTLGIQIFIKAKELKRAKNKLRKTSDKDKKQP